MISTYNTTDSYGKFILKKLKYGVLVSVLLHDEPTKVWSHVGTTLWNHQLQHGVEWKDLIVSCVSIKYPFMNMNINSWVLTFSGGTLRIFNPTGVLPLQSGLNFRVAMHRGFDHRWADPLIQSVPSVGPRKRRKGIIYEWLILYKI